MKKNVLIIAGSPRREGNSDLLCEAFAQGAREAGHSVEMVTLRSPAHRALSGVLWLPREPCVRAEG